MCRSRPSGVTSFFLRRSLTSWTGCRSLAVLLLLFLTLGCGRKVIIPSEARPVPQKKELHPMGYSIQVGAFSKVERAIQFTESLERLGLTAYYFRHSSGIYKVRFGDFPTKEEARAKAENLVTKGIIDAYYIVGPDDYALAMARIYGSKGLRNEIVKTAESYIGLPYQWGGSSLEGGFDCSGLTMAVYQLNGLNLPRSSKDQFESGDPVDRSGLVKGDLVFFAVKKGQKVGHVGVYVGDGRFIHAPSTGKTIRTDSLSDNFYASRYAGARTYLP